MAAPRRSFKAVYVYEYVYRFAEYECGGTAEGLIGFPIFTTASCRISRTLRVSPILLSPRPGNKLVTDWLVDTRRDTRLDVDHL